MINLARQGSVLLFLVLCTYCASLSCATAATPQRNSLNEVAWLQQFVDQGFIQYEVAREQPLSNGAVNCNISSNGTAVFTDVLCQQFSFYSAAYGVVLGPTDPTDGRDYIHHALAMITYPIPQQNASTGAYPPSSGGCSHPSAWCTAEDMTFAYGDFSHTIELLNQSPFYAQSDTEDHSIVSNTIIPSLSLGLSWLIQSGANDAYPDMLNDYTATNRILIHAGAYYLTGDVTSPYNASVASTGESDGMAFVNEGTVPQHYVEFDLPNKYYSPSSFTCVPASLCPWAPASGFWIENEGQANSASGFDSGYGGVGIRRADFLATHALGSNSTLTTLDSELQAYSTWLYKRVVSSAGLISEEGNYRTCGQPNPPYDTQNCPPVNPQAVNMAWEEVAWALYNEAPFAPDAAGASCGQYIAAARAVSYYYMPNSGYLHYPPEQASSYNIPSPNAPAPSACSETFSTVQQAKRGIGSRATAFADARSYGGGGVRISNGDSIVLPPADGGTTGRSHSVAIVYSLQGSQPQFALLRNNNLPAIRVLLSPTGSGASVRQFRTLDVAKVPTLLGRRNSITVAAERGTYGIDISSVTLRKDLSELRAR